MDDRKAHERLIGIIRVHSCVFVAQTSETAKLLRFLVQFGPPNSLGHELTRMNTNVCATDTDRLDAIVQSVIGAAYEVSNLLGSGFLEKVYERALGRELALRGLNARSQMSFLVSYKGQCVGEYVADLVVEDCIIVELKCVDRFANEHIARCINYLKASHLRLALLINFQK